MNNQKIGSAGGRAHALMSKQEAAERIKQYNKNPNHCLYCNKLILMNGKKRFSDIKTQKFCNRSCATAYNNKKEYF